MGALFAAGIYMLLRRSVVKLLFGFVLLGNAVNLVIFTVGGFARGRAPIVAPGGEKLQPPYADPLAQALILTAIVISFGVLAFGMVLVRRVYADLGTDDVDELRSADE